MRTEKLPTSMISLVPGILKHPLTPVIIAGMALFSGCTTSTPYVTRKCFVENEFLPATKFNEIAAVPGWREACESQQAGRPVLMENQGSVRGCVDEVLRCLVNWCNTRWTVPVGALPLGRGATNSWRDPYESTRDGYVPGDVVLAYFNQELTPKLTGGYRLEELPNATMDLLRTEVRRGAPLVVPYMLSPIPRCGRAMGRFFLAVSYPIDRLIYWGTLCGGPGWSFQREWFLNGEDDIHEHYLHAAVVVGVFERVKDQKQFVLLLDPWGGDAIVFSKKSSICEVLPVEEFERRWQQWNQLNIPPKIAAKWHRMAKPGTMLVLRK